MDVDILSGLRMGKIERSGGNERADVCVSEPSQGLLVDWFKKKVSGWSSSLRVLGNVLRVLESY